MSVSLAVPILLLLCSLHSAVETRGLPEDTQIPEDIADPTVLEITGSLSVESCLPFHFENEL